MTANLRQDSLQNRTIAQTAHSRFFAGFGDLKLELLFRVKLVGSLIVYIRIRAWNSRHEINKIGLIDLVEPEWFPCNYLFLLGAW